MTVIEYLKQKKPDYRFRHAGNEYYAVYETVESIAKNIGKSKSTVYRQVNKLNGTEGFMFSQKVISFEYLTPLT